jgi:hypothetical protein
MAMEKFCIRSILFVTALLGSCFAHAGEMDQFAKCISKSGARYYGAHWCPVCAKQNAIFGDAWKKLPYIECSKRGSRERLARCENVPGFPFWVFEDGGGYAGLLSVPLLAEFTHCPRPGGR